MSHRLIQTLIDDSGVTAIEYAMIAMFVALVCIVAWQLLGTNLSTSFGNLASSI
ncbi:MAG: Flp family type IVb pilin [Alphaproteobacteria bacterium]|nr:Flp family type IVb pilin [Alphaproteobacteria bacterium]